MVISEIKSNLSDFLVNLPPALSIRVDNIFTIVKAAGIAFIVYVIYLQLQIHNLYISKKASYDL